MSFTKSTGHKSNHPEWIAAGNMKHKVQVHIADIMSRMTYDQSNRLLGSTGAQSARQKKLWMIVSG